MIALKTPIAKLGVKNTMCKAKEANKDLCALSRMLYRSLSKASYGSLLNFMCAITTNLMRLIM